MSPDLTQDPIYKALIALGKRAKLDAVAVTSYPALLNSEEVRRRAGKDATELERAECAETIIRDFIATNVTPGQPRDILEAALGLTEQSEGRSIATRHNDLHVSNTTFTGVRRKWFEELTRLLHGFPPQEHPSVTTGVGTSTGFEPIAMEPALSVEMRIALGYSFFSLGRDALRLHFAVIACLLERELCESAPAIPPGASPCHKLLFEALREFRTTSAYWQTVPGQLRQLFYDDPKPAVVDDFMTEALAGIMDLWPLAEVQAESELVLPYVMELALNHGGSLNHEDLYWDAWLPWYEERHSPDIDTLSTHSGAVAAIVIVGGGRDLGDAERALLEMRRAVDRRFRGSWDEDLRGQPFHDYFQAFALSHLHTWLKLPLGDIVERM